MINNKFVKKAEKEYEYLTGDAAERRLAELREKAIRDEAAGLISARRKGIEEGIKQKALEDAKKMLKEKIDIDVIIKITELSREEIEKLK